MKLAVMIIEHGTPYYLPTNGYFFNYLPNAQGMIEVSLFSEEKGDTPLDKVVLAKSNLNKSVHHQMINRFEAKVSLGLVS